MDQLINKTLLKNRGFRFLIPILFVSAITFAQNPDCKLKIGTNLTGLCDWMTEMPFVDMMHHARTWGTRNKTDWVDGWKNEWDTELAGLIEKDENGYPLEVPFYINNIGLEDSQIVFTVWAWLEAWEAGTYICLYDGEGEMQFGADGTILSSQPGRLEVRIQPDKENPFLELKILRSKRGNHLRNIRLILPGHENSYATQPFNPLYLEKLKPFKALRFMDWGHTNNWGHDYSWTCDDGPEDTILTRWDERSSMTQFTWSDNKGVPYEMMCDLCNSLGVDMWVNVPYSASDEYISQMANLIKHRLNPGLRIYVEYGNEDWNWMFGQALWLNTFYCVNKGKDWPEGIVDRIQNNLNIWTTAYADNPARLTRVVGVQTAWQDVSNRIVRNLNPESFDAVAVTGYFGLSEEGDSILDQLGAEATVADVALQVRKEMITNEIEWIKDDYQELGFPLNKEIVYYEAGQSITPTPFGEEPTYAQALLDIQRDTTIYNLYKEWFALIEKVIPDGQQALYMNFSFIGSLDARYGSWGVLETLDQDTSRIPAPKYRALLEQINKCSTTTGTSDQMLPAMATEQIKLVKRANRQFVVYATAPIKEVSIFDCNGKKLTLIKCKNPGYAELNMEGLASGSYIIRVRTTDYESTKKLIIK